MTGQRDSLLLRLHGKFARVLSIVLLSFVFYGTTVEAAHTHAKRARTDNAAGDSTVSVPQKETDANPSLLDCGECLICQLHQHFSTGLISELPSVTPAVRRSYTVNLSHVSVYSYATAPRTGRAPPSSS